MIKPKKRKLRRAYPMPPAGLIGLSPDQACAVMGLGRTKLDEIVKTGELRARKLGKKKIIIARADAEAYLQNLPEVRR